MDELTRRGVELFNAGRFDEALASFRAALAAGAEPAGTRCFVAHVLASAGRPEEAAREFAEVAREFPRHLPAYDGLSGMILRGQAGAAHARALEALLGAAPGASVPRKALGASLRLYAQAARSLRDLDAAERALYRAARLLPGDREIRRRLLDLHHEREQAYLAEVSAAADSEADEKALRRLLELKPGDADVRVRLLGVMRARAKALAAAGRPGQAESVLRRALAFEPSDAESRALLAEAVRAGGERRGGLELAERELRKGLALAPRDRELRRRLLEVLRRRSVDDIERGRVESDAAILAAARRAGASEREARAHLAETLRLRALALAPDRLAAVERALRRALRARPRDARTRALLLDVLRRRGAAALAAGDLRGAERRLLRAAAFAPRDPDTRAALLEVLSLAARGCLSAGKREGARALARRALRLAPRDARAWLIEGEVLFVSGDKGPARRALGRALRFDAGSFSRQERFKALMKSGSYRRALAAAERVLDAGPALEDLRAFWDPWEWDERVPRAEREAEVRELEKAAGGSREPWALYYRGALAGPDAMACFERVSRLPSARYGWMLAKAATTAMWAGDFPRAASWFERALACGPADWRARAFLAEAYLCLHKPAEACAEMDRAAAAAPQSEAGQVLAWRGAFDLWLGRYDEALERLERAERLGAQCAPCWKGAALLKLGRPEEALAVLDDALRRYPLDFEAYIWRGEAKRVLGRHREALADLDAIPLPDAAATWLWALFNRSLAKEALGDEAGAAADFAAIPAPVTAYIRARRSLPEDARGEILRAGLELARGFRREEYGQAIWME